MPGTKQENSFVENMRNIFFEQANLLGEDKTELDLLRSIFNAQCEVIADYGTIDDLKAVVKEQERLTDEILKRD